MRFLASDLLRGREPGTPGFDIAADYVESHFRQSGLEPAGDAGGYRQYVPLRVTRRDPEAARMELRGPDTNRTLTHGEDFVTDPEPGRASSSVTAPVLFVGYGIEAPELGHDDYAGLDTEGKIVLVLTGAPAALPTDEKAHLSRDETKARTAARHGAVGMLRVAPPGSPESISPGGRGSSLSWVRSDGRGHDAADDLRAGATVSQAVATSMFQAAASSFREAGAMPGGFDLEVEVTLTQESLHEDFASPNVVARLPGSDPALRDEHVVLTAHLDHVGVGRPDASGDEIYNGAGDNASGTAVLLEVARALAAEPPRRSVLFAAVTAEERGLVGTDYLVHNPPVPIEDIIANINLDSGVFLYDFVDIIPFGTKHSSLDANVRRVAAAAGLAVGSDPLPEEALFTRSDHYRFVQQGIRRCSSCVGWTPVMRGSTVSPSCAVTSPSTCTSPRTRSTCRGTTTRPPATPASSPRRRATSPMPTAGRAGTPAACSRRGRRADPTQGMAA